MTGLPPCPHCGQQHAEDVLLCPTAEKLMPLSGRVLDGKFRFVKQLGEGGMGAVWKAENVLVKKTVAIKLMHVQFSKDEGVLSRFRNEATAAGRIGSKHICDILDLGRSQLGPYIVMEMLQGADFAQFMQQRSPVDPGTVVMVMRQALEGLQAAHAAGIVHRDLKPENIFLHEPEPGQLLVKLMDFGISKFTEGEMAGKTGMGVLMGTPEYMSPEQTEGAAQADHRTDIWAMGVILYWALAGRNPFMGATMASTLINVTTREPTPITQAVPGIDPGLAAVVERCIKKNPAERFDSSAEMSAALEPFENLQGGFFVPFLSKSGSTGRGTSAPASAPTPPPGATVASSGPPPMRPPSAPPAAAGMAPPSSSASEDVMVMGAGVAGAGPTFSSELSGAPAGAQPTIAGGGDWGAIGDELDSRPDSNMSSGKGGMLVIALVALGLIGGGGYMAYAAMQEPDAKTVAADAAAKAEQQQAEAKAAEDAAKAAAEAEAAKLPDVGGGEEAGAEAGETAEGDAAVAGAEGGAAEGGAAEGGAAEGGAAEGGAAEGGAAEGGGAEGGDTPADSGDSKPSGGDSKPSGGDSKPSGGDSKPSGGGGSKKGGGGSKKGGGGSKKGGGGSKPDDGGGDGGGKLTPSKPPRDDTSGAKKKKKKKKKGKKKKKKGTKKKLSPGG